MIKYCLFPVAGFGTRFLPVTKTVPKELLPIIEKPLIQYSVDEAHEAGATDMIFVINEYKLAIKKYFEPFPYLESLINSSPKINKLDCIKNITKNCNLNFINQTEMLGLGHAIYQGKRLIGSHPFAVILPDDLCHNRGDSVLKQMLEIYTMNMDKCIVAVEEVESNEVAKYGIIDAKPIHEHPNLYRVSTMIEKPDPSISPSNLAIIGRYILTPAIFDELSNLSPDHNGEIQITGALNILAGQGKVLAYKFSGTRIDCGTVNGFVKANNFFEKLEQS